MRSFPIACGLLLVTVIVEGLTACGIEERGNRQREIVYVTSAESLDGNPAQTPELPQDSHHNVDAPITADDKPPEVMGSVVEVPVRFGIRDFVQINATMEKLTGVPATTASIRTVYANDLITQLPSGNDLKAFLSSHQVGISKLATEYCDVLFANTTMRAALLTGFNFNQAPAAALADPQAASVSSALLDRFLGQQLEFQSDRPSAIADVKALIADLVKTAPAATPAETLNILKGACTAVLASSSVSTL